MRASRMLTLVLAGSIFVSPILAAAQEYGPVVGTGGGGGSFPAFGYCIFGAAFGPIWSTLRLNRELKANEAYQAMSLCGLGSFVLVQQNQK